MKKQDIALVAIITLLVFNLLVSSKISNTLKLYDIDKTEYCTDKD